MEKPRRVNWIMVITGVLFLVSVGVLGYKLFSGEEVTSCSFEGGEVDYGKEVISAKGERCVCGDKRKMVCQGEESNGEQESFSTEGLVFEYSYLNTVVGDSPNISRVLPIDINQNEGELEVILERESWCSEDFEASSQVGYYEKYSDKLVLSTITSSDAEKFNIPCVVSNTFKIANFDIEDVEDFEIYYRNEKGKEFDLMACSYNGVLYGEGDIFAGGSNEAVCSCEQGKVACE